jgi:regulator of replication initiation timing
MIEVILATAGAIVTALGAWFVAKTQVNFKRQKYYEDKITEILELQSQEIKSLKSEIEKLVQENRWLRLELERGNHYHEKEMDNPAQAVAE